MHTSLRHRVACAGFAGLTTLSLVAVATPTSAASGPAISKLSPAYGPVGSALVIHGTGMVNATFTLNNLALPAAQPATDTEADVTIPTGATAGHVVGHQGVTSFTGPVFHVQQPTAATEKLSKTSLTYPHKITVSATLKRASDGKLLQGSEAHLQRQLHGSSAWHHLKGTSGKKTSSHGVVSWKVAPSQNVKLRVRFAPTRSRLGTTTGTQSLAVHPSIHLSVPHTLQTHTSSDIAGQVSPHLSGKVTVQRRVHGKWHTLAHPTAHHGKFSTKFTPSSAGKYAFRASRSADASHKSATSHVATTQAIARTLRLGSKGHDVAALQRALRKLHYDVGPKSSYYGYDMLHAVTAFEKINHLSKDGAAGAGVQKRLAGHPTKPHLRHPLNDSVSVEVDLHRQVLFIAKHGHIWRILDTSTAGGYYYTNSEGNQEKAVTPTGHFSIKYKREGTVHSKLGTLYRPSYFNYSGYAIHGEGNGNGGGNVPPYANSHGCVRITDLATDRYYHLLAVGVSVWIYS